MRTAFVPSPSFQPATPPCSTPYHPYPTPPALSNTIPCLTRHTNNFDFASDAWMSIMLDSSSGCSGKRSSSFFSPDRPPIYPHKRTPAPQTPSASARTPAAAAQTPQTPPIYKSPLAIAGSSADLKAHVHPSVSTLSDHFHLVSKSPAAAAGAAAISLRRSPRLATPTSSNQPPHAHAHNVPSKTLGRVDDARHSRIMKMVVSACCVCVRFCVRVLMTKARNQSSTISSPSLPPPPALFWPSGSKSTPRHPKRTFPGDVAALVTLCSLTNPYSQRARMGGDEGAVPPGHAAAARSSLSSPPPPKADFAPRLHEFLISKGRTSQNRSFRLE